MLKFKRKFRRQRVVSSSALHAWRWRTLPVSLGCILDVQTWFDYGLSIGWWFLCTIIPDLSRLALNVVCSRTWDATFGAQIRTYHAENILESLYSHNQEFRLDYLVEIRKQGALVETEPAFKLGNRTERLGHLKLTQCVGGHWLERGAATAG